MYTYTYMYMYILVAYNTVIIIINYYTESVTCLYYICLYNYTCTCISTYFTAGTKMRSLAQEGDTPPDVFMAPIG